MTRRPHTGKHMKIRNVITTIGMATLAAINLSLNASEPLLSPRAQDSQVKIAPSTVEKTTVAPERYKFTGSPRALDAHANHVKGTGDSANLTARKCAVIGSPRQAETSTLSCCKAAKASCTAGMACCAK